MRIKYKIMLAIITVGIGICLMTYQSYALWVANFSGGENIVEMSCFSFEFKEGTQSISLNNTYPVSDSKGLTTTPYTFTITNTCTVDIQYSVTLNTLTTNTENSKNWIKYALHNTKNDKPTYGINLGMNKLYNTSTEELQIENLDESIIIDIGKLKGRSSKDVDDGESITYNLYLWMDEQTGNEGMNMTFEASLNILSTATTKGDEITLIEVLNTLPKVSSSVSGLYARKHNTASITYSTDIDAINNYKQTELRFVGKDPNNYVLFNNELWRIIGLVNTNNGQRVKLIRDEFIGKYSWDYSDSTVNNGAGINEWSQADLMKLINPGYEDEPVGGSLYWNKTSGNCYSGSTIENCDFSNIGLTDEAKNMIEETEWLLGSNGSTPYGDSSGTTSKFYDWERSNNTSKICTNGTYCNDTINRQNVWKGYVGLMYPSDLGYAVPESYGSCYGQELDGWMDTSGFMICYGDNWIANSSVYEWSIFAASSTNRASYVLGVANRVIGNNAIVSYYVRPVVYLKPEVIVFAGNGSQNSPYVLSIN